MGFDNGTRIPPEIIFLKKVFREHYSKIPIDPPYRFPRREWGFFPFGGKMMFRHISFQRRSEINDFFRDTAPMHAYYSVAYYGDPSLQPMGDKFKTWMGADLIFDLDADHLPNADEMSYQEQLENVKKELKRLINFLQSDFDLVNDFHIHFSGGRGYHIHIRDLRVLSLDSRDRRAIVDYITGRGIDYNRFFVKKRTLDFDSPDNNIGRDLSRRTSGKLYLRKVRPRSDGGWIERLYRSKNDLVEQLINIESNKKRYDIIRNINNQESLKINDNTIKNIIKNIFHNESKKIAERMLEEDLFDVFPSGPQENAFLSILVAMAKVNLSGETDEPVTTDIKRLIRCPGSLHGKTGMKVMEVERDKLDEYDPLRDAVALSDDPVKVMVSGPVEQYLGGENFSLKEGETEVPLYMAYFLIARRLATLP